MAKFKVGDRVRIATTSGYYRPDAPSNPINISGSVARAGKDYVYVDWDNKRHNSYNHHDLVFEEPPKPITLEEEFSKAVEVLKAIQDNVDFKAVIAGGACRDWLLGKNCNDVDIFLSVPDNYTREEVQEILSRAMDQSVGVLGEYGADAETMNGMTMTFNTFKDRKEYQFLVVKGNPREVMNLFPFSHTMCTFDGSDYTKHGLFDMFLHHKVVTKVRDCEQRYKNKVERFVADGGYALAKDPFEALILASKSGNVVK